ncbi:hypothetical protein [Actinophytocola glycyrrhizae]|uniref:Golgi phosphoprotein 3 GPP34 n=1 Tax=Actinophytocola glycyrrhizae TaxID=2044873 RepID=A0ABV9SC21_9PSEU
MIGLDRPELALLREDLAYHQARILLLVAAVASTDGHGKKLDGLTKLAKLDFLIRYPALGPLVLDGLDPTDPRLHLPDAEASPTQTEAPMIRYKYGPWDDRYYAVIGALVGRGLIRYAKGRKGSVALATTLAGRTAAARLADNPKWSDIAERSTAIAQASSGMTGNQLKHRIYDRLADLMNRPHRQEIR